MTKMLSGIVFVLVSTATLVSCSGDLKPIATGFAFTEGPAFGPDGRLYFSDIVRSRIHVFDPESGRVTVHRAGTGGANGLAWSADGSTLFACEGKARRVSRQRGAIVETVAERFEGRRFHAPNDLTLDAHGGLYFTDPAYGLSEGEKELPHEGVYYVAADGSVTEVVADLKRPNGITLNAAGTVLVVADHSGSAIWKYPVLGPGRLGPGMRFADIGSDGLEFDSKGNLVCTWQRAIVVLAPDGREVRRFAIPEPPTNVALVGRKLYVTARESLYLLGWDPP